MDQHKQALVRGIALGLGFVGVWGLAIQASLWAVSLTLVTLSLIVWLIGNKKEKK